MLQDSKCQKVSEDGTADQMRSSCQGSRPFERVTGGSTDCSSKRPILVLQKRYQSYYKSYQIVRYSEICSFLLNKRNTKCPFSLYVACPELSPGRRTQFPRNWEICLTPGHCLSTLFQECPRMTSVAFLFPWLPWWCVIKHLWNFGVLERASSYKRCVFIIWYLQAPGRHVYFMKQITCSGAVNKSLNVPRFLILASCRLLVPPP